MKRRKYKIFMYYFVTYIAIVAILLSTAMYLLNSSLHRLENNLIEQNISSVKAHSNEVNDVLEELNRLTMILQLNSNLSTFLSLNSFDHAGIYMLSNLHLIRELDNMKLINSEIHDIFVYSSNSGVVVNSEEIFINSEIFYSISTINTKELGHDSFMQTYVANSPNHSLVPYNTGNGNFYFYTSTIPANANPVVNDGSIIICLSDSIFSDTFSSLNLGEDGYFQVADRNNNTLYSTGNRDNYLSALENGEIDLLSLNSNEYVDENYMGIDYIAFEITCEESGFVYSAFFQKNSVVVQTHEFFLLATAILMLSVLFSIILAIFMSKYNAKPIEAILEIQPNTQKTKSPFSYKEVKNTIDNVVSSNTQMSEQISKQIPIVQSTTIQNILNGNFSSEMEIESLLHLASIEFNKQYFTAVIVKSTNKISNLITLINDVANFHNITSHGYNMDSNRRAYIFNHDCENIQIALEYLKESVNQTTDLNIVCAVGETKKAVIEVNHSFEEAVHIILTIPENADKACYYLNDITQEIFDFYYPFDIEQKIIKSALQGDSEKVTKLLSNLYEENFIRRKLMYDVYRYFIHTLYTTLIRSLKNTDYYVDSDLFLLNTTPPREFKAVYDDIVSEFISVCNYNRSTTGLDDSFKIKSIVDYIEKNYSDAALTLSDLSEKFKIPERSLYWSFKESLGVTFTSYLENYRLSKAKTLLKNQSVSIEKISVMVGYSSTRTFQRAFKRQEGVSPNDYREK